MPLPMVHLLLAEKIGEKTGQKPDAYFLLGSIAPDAIHMRPGTTRKDKHQTHFFDGNKWDVEQIYLHWETILQKLQAYHFENSKERSFTIGYYVHTILDMIWIVQVFNVLEKTLRSGGIGFEDIRTKYYAETNACDAFLYQQCSWVPRTETLLEQVSPLGFDSLLTAHEIGLWRDVVLGKMERYKTMEEKETVYITTRNIQRLIDSVAGKIVTASAEKGYKLL